MLARLAVGRSTVAFVSRMREHGSVSRRTCPGDESGADRRMGSVFRELGVVPQKSVVTGTCADGVGFLDQCHVRDRDGFWETDRDYAAFFGRVRDGVAIATHMADCGFAAVEFPGVFGFIHLTRENMSAPAARELLHAALVHYGGRVEDVRIRLVSGITGPNYPHHFADIDGCRPEERFPGWFAKGLLRNKTRPFWWPSDGLDPTDLWEPDNREMMRRRLLETGIAPRQLEMRDAIDPGDIASGHASHSLAMRGLAPVGRDAYVVAPRALVSAGVLPTSETAGLPTSGTAVLPTAGTAAPATRAARANSSSRLRAKPSRPS